MAAYTAKKKYYNRYIKLRDHVATILDHPRQAVSYDLNRWTDVQYCFMTQHPHSSEEINGLKTFVICERQNAVQITDVIIHRDVVQKSHMICSGYLQHLRSPRIRHT